MNASNHQLKKPPAWLTTSALIYPELYKLSKSSSSTSLPGHIPLSLPASSVTSNQHLESSPLFLPPVIQNQLTDAPSASDEITATAKRKVGRRQRDDEPKSKRTAQNRAAQRAFRERKQAYLQELEARVYELEALQQVKDFDLAKENHRLNQKLKELEFENNRLKTNNSFHFEFPIPPQTSTDIPSSITNFNLASNITASPFALDTMSITGLDSFTDLFGDSVQSNIDTPPVSARYDQHGNDPSELSDTFDFDEYFALPAVIESQLTTKEQSLRDQETPEAFQVIETHII